MNTRITRAISEHIHNYHAEKGTKWREPIVGFADAKDPLFTKLKTVISSTHAMPEDIVQGAKSVIVFFIPFDEAIINSNIEEIQSSIEWDMAKIETNMLIQSIHTMLHDLIQSNGYESSIVHNATDYDEELLQSDWSHRHVAYIAGVGTFGIHNLLITEQGCCGRIGSLITTMPLEATQTLQHENCLFKYNGSCAMCAEKCVAKAISTDNGYPYVNKKRCNEQIYDGLVPQYENGIGDTCGKCMSGVPCSLQNPCSRLQKKASIG